MNEKRAVTYFFLMTMLHKTGRAPFARVTRPVGFYEVRGGADDYFLPFFLSRSSLSFFLS